jgi:hypothetical protein
MQNSRKSRESSSPGERKNYHEAQEGKAFIEGKCYYEALGLKRGNEEVGESRC